MIEVVGKRAYAARNHAVTSLGWKANLYAYRFLYNHDRLGWPGRSSAMSALTKPFPRRPGSPLKSLAHSSLADHELYNRRHP